MVLARILAVVLAVVCSAAWAHPVDPLTEVRYCGAPERDAAGKIKRSQAVLRAFQRIYPCPSTGEKTGACPGWAINHTIPLACGGCDSLANLDWMPNQIKSCSEPWCRDRWERQVYDRPTDTDTPSCTNRVQSWSKP